MEKGGRKFSGHQPTRWKIVTRDRKSAYISQGHLTQKYSLSYKKGSKVTAPADTLGIFVYETRRHAKEALLRGGHKMNPETHMIIRVKPVGSDKKLLIRPTDFGPIIIEELGKAKKEIKKTRGLLLLNGGIDLPYVRLFNKNPKNYDGTMLYDAVIPSVSWIRHLRT